MDFENLLNTSHEMYAKKNLACITKVPTAFLPKRENGQITSAIVRKKSICDYIGVVSGRAIALEAKSVSKVDWAIRNDAVQPHQSTFLSQWEQNGGMSLVIVAFGLDKFVVVPWSWWQDWGKKIETGERKKSAKISDFPDRSKFGIGGRVPCDWLKVVESLKR